MSGMTDTRGFSTSASALIIFVGMFGALAGLYAATSNATEQVREAETDQLDQTENIQRTAINVTNATLVDDTAPCELRLDVENTGSTTLQVADTDLLLDGAYQTGWREGATVDGNPDTTTWRPAETLSVTVDGLSAVPDGAKFVTPTGVADVKDIDGGLTCT